MKATQEQSWTEVTQLFEAAVEMLPEERDAFLARACAGDTELRREVQSLLDADAEAGHFMEIPAEQEPPTSGVTMPSGEGATLPSVDGPEEPLKPGSPLGRYVVRERLGAGGMGVVYEAYDPELNRKIAIKLMRPGSFRNTSASEGRARLIREAQAMAQLSHPNVIAVHDVGTFGDQIFIAIEYVEGSTLTQWLAEQKRPWREILDMFVQTGRGLAAAHAAGILHRDFKPDNVLVGQDGRPRVLDFGLALALFGEPEKRAPDDEPAKADAVSPSKLLPLATVLTQPGRLMGTPAYMAPEQLMGQGADHRTDQYSFCVALYQGLYGELPFNAEDLRALLRRTGQRRVKVFKSKDLPASVEQALLRGLSFDPADRFPSMEALLEKLEQQLAVPRRRTIKLGADADRSIAVLAVVLLGAIFIASAAGLYLYVKGQAPRSPGGPPKSVIVLPFINASASEDAEYLSDGIAETLIDNLSQIPELKVIARHTAFTYKGKAIDPQELRRILAVDVVLTGRIQQHGDALVIHTDLVSAVDGSQLWGKKYNRKFTDLLAVEEEIAQAISEKLRPRLSSVVQRRVTKSPTDNPEAYQLYLRGRYFWNMRKEEFLNKSIEYFQRALELDRNFALAYAGLADSYLLLSLAMVTWPTEEILAKAEAAALKALAIDDELAEPHASLGLLKMGQWDWLAAEKQFKRAIELNPNYAPVHHWYGMYLFYIGLSDQAEAEAIRAQQLDPTTSVYVAPLGTIFCRRGEYVRAVEQFQFAIELNPKQGAMRAALADCYFERKMYQEAIAELEKALAINHNSPLFLSDLARAYVRLGNKDRPLTILNQLKERDAAGQFDHAVSIGRLYIELGDKESAFEWLEKAYQRHSVELFGLKQFSAYDSLRSDPRFEDLVRRVGFPP